MLIEKRIVNYFRMREKVGLKVVKVLKRKDNGVIYVVIDVLCVLM